MCKAVSGLVVHLSENVWFRKIIIDHPEFSKRKEYLGEVKKTIEDPEFVIAGWSGELLALRFWEIAPSSPKYLCVSYRETDGKGFIMTTFFISKVNKLLRRGILWSKPK